MNWPFHIAKRYLFAKKSTNAVNLIAGIAVFGIAIGTAVLILVLSVFNGFEGVLASLFNAFNPDVKVTVNEGKTFSVDSIKLARIEAIPEVAHLSVTLEEVAFFEYDGSQAFGLLKGVDDQYRMVSKIDSSVREGTYQLNDGNRDLAVLGLNMRNKLSTDPDDPIEPLFVYMAKKKTGAFGEPFRRKIAYPSGTFVIQQEYNQYVLSSLDFARSILSLPNGASALEISLIPSNSELPYGRSPFAPKVIEQIREILGESFIVKDRYQQDEAVFKLMKLEKWVSFAILSLTLILVAFNMVGALWMLMLEKKKDIAILKSLGANDHKVRNIFLNEGFLLCLTGLVAGILFAIGFYLAQTNFGVVGVPEGFVVDAYPIELKLLDFVAVSGVVLLIGFLASLPPALKAMKINTIIRE